MLSRVSIARWCRVDWSSTNRLHRGDSMASEDFFWPRGINLSTDARGEILRVVSVVMQSARN